MKSEKTPIGNISSVADIGKFVAARRKKQGLTQADLAGLSGCGLRFIGELERGKGTLQADKVLQVIRLLGLDVVLTERRQ
jgi:y4mF family transcriptional regulator